MTTSSITIQLACRIEQAWNIVTSPDRYAWRSDLDRIVVVENGKTFIEYTTGGYSTTFTITVFEPMTRYEFDMENSRMKGHWIGTFSSEADCTKIHFTEHVHAKNILLRPFIRFYLKQQQKRYIGDLLKELRQHPSKDIDHN